MLAPLLKTRSARRLSLEALEKRVLLAITVDNGLPTDSADYFAVEIGPGCTSTYSSLAGTDTIYEYYGYLDYNGTVFNMADEGTDPVSQDGKATSTASLSVGGGTVNMVIESYIPDGTRTLITDYKLTASGGADLTNAKFFQYLDCDIDLVSDDILTYTGAIPTGDLVLTTIDPATGIYQSQSIGPNLASSSASGWAADEFDFLRSDLEAGGFDASQAGTINTTNLPAGNWAAYGSGYGPADVTTAIEFTLTSSTSATVSATLHVAPPELSTDTWTGFAEPLVSDVGPSQIDVAVHDFNTDGRPDILTSESDSVTMLWGSGHERTLQFYTGSFLDDVGDPTVAPEDRIGHNPDGSDRDLVDGSVAFWDSFMSPRGGGQVVVGQFDTNTPRMDICTVVEEGVAVLASNSIGPEGEYVVGEVTPLISTVTGLPHDIKAIAGIGPENANVAVVTSTDGDAKMIVLAGDGAGGFTPTEYAADGGGLSDVAVGEVTGDDIEDIVALDFDNNELLIYTGASNGYSLDTIIPLSGMQDGPASLVLVDLNGDGLLDVVVANEFGQKGSAAANRHLTVLLNSEDGFGTPQYYNIDVDNQADYPRTLTYGDYNNDGNVDIAVGNAVRGEIIVMRGTGGGALEYSQTFHVGEETSIRALATPTGLESDPDYVDMDQDGFPDIVALTQTSAYTFLNLGNQVSGGGQDPFIRMQEPREDRYYGFSPGVAIEDGALDLAHRNPESVAHGDLNGDGYDDVIAGNRADRTISVYLSSGYNTYKSPVVYSGLNGVVDGVGALDYDGDGDIDVFGVYPTQNMIQIFENDGFGSLTAGSTYGTAQTPTGAPVVADFDGSVNGLDDIALMTSGSNIILLNNTGGGFGSSVVNAGGTVTDMELADFNGDAKADLLVGRSTAGPRAMLNPAGGGSNVDIAASNSQLVAAGDFDGDGMDDAAFYNKNTLVMNVFLNTGGAFAAAPTPSYLLGGKPIDLASNDLDRDGFGDVVALVEAHGDLSLVTFLAEYGDPVGLGVFLAPDTFPISTDASAFVLGDLNADWYPDILTVDPSDGVNVYYAYSAESVKVEWSDWAMTVRRPTSVAVGDVDGDGDADVVVGSELGASFTVYTNVDGQLLLPAPYQDPGLPVTSVVLTDVDNDGWLDVVAQFDGNGAVGVYLNEQNGNFASPVMFNAVTQSTGNIGVGDFDGNGLPDLVILDHGTQTDPVNDIWDGTQVGVLMNTSTPGAASFAPVSLVNVGPDPDGVTVGDFDNDTSMDFAVILADDAGGVPRIGTFFGNGGGAFAAGPVLAVTNPVDIEATDLDADQADDIVALTNALETANHVALGDVDGNGSMDVVVGNEELGTISTFLNSGGVLTAPTSVASTGAGVMDVQLADLDGDNRLDIIARYEGSSALGVYGGAGNGSFAAPIMFASVTSPTAEIAIADLNGDNLPDVAVSDAGAANDGTQVGVLLNTSSVGSFSFAAVSAVTVGPDPRGLMLADVNQDSNMDMIVALSDPSGVGDGVAVLLGAGDGTFGAPTVLNFDRPIGVTVLDSDGDGDADIAAISQSTDTIQIFKNNGAGTFTVDASVPLGANPLRVAAVDLDLDLDTDLVVLTDRADTPISVVANLGNTNFMAPVHYAAAGTPADLAVGNIGGTLYPDVVVAGGAGPQVLTGNGVGGLNAATQYSVGGAVTVFLSDSAGNFGALTPTPIDDTPVAMGVGLVDGDITPDLVVLTNDATTPVSVLLGRPDGTLSDPIDSVVGNAPVAVAFGQITGDASTDLALAGGAGPAVLEGLGTGAFGDADQYYSSQLDDPNATLELYYFTQFDLRPVKLAGPFSIADEGNYFVWNSGNPLPGMDNIRPADYLYEAGNEIYFRMIARNGERQVVFDDTITPIRIGDAGFWLGLEDKVVLDAGDQPYRLVQQDMNGDDWPDLVTLSTEGELLHVFYNMADAIPLGWPADQPFWDSIPSDWAEFVQFDVSDVNNDTTNYPAPLPGGYVANTPTSVYVRNDVPDLWYDLGALERGDVMRGLSIDYPNTLSLGGDRDYFRFIRKPDWRPINVAMNDTNSDYDPADSYESDTEPYDLAAADMDGDGILDIVTTGTIGPQIMYGLPGGGYSEPRVYTTTPGRELGGFAMGDLDDNGYVDLVTANTGGPHAVFSVYFNFQGSLRDPVRYSLEGLPYDVGGVSIADVDDDGDLDVAVTLDGSDQVRIYTNDGTGLLGDPVALTSGTNLRSTIMLVDLTGDALPELVTFDYGGPMMVHRNTTTGGTVTFDPPTTLALSGAPQDAGYTPVFNDDVLLVDGLTLGADGADERLVGLTVAEDGGFDGVEVVWAVYHTATDTLTFPLANDTYGFANPIALEMADINDDDIADFMVMSSTTFETFEGDALRAFAGVANTEPAPPAGAGTLYGFKIMQQIGHPENDDVFFLTHDADTEPNDTIDVQWNAAEGDLEAWLRPVDGLVPTPFTLVAPGHLQLNLDANTAYGENYDLWVGGANLYDVVGDYTISLTPWARAGADDYEPNDTNATATDLDAVATPGPGIAGTETFWGANLQVADQDWYMFTVPVGYAPGNDDFVRIDFSAAYDLDLYVAEYGNGIANPPTLVRQSLAPTGESEQVSLAPFTPGATIYVRVMGDATDEGYRLTVALPDVSPDWAEDNDTQMQATYLGPIAGHYELSDLSITPSEMYDPNADVDWYSFTSVQPTLDAQEDYGITVYYDGEGVPTGNDLDVQLRDHEGNIITAPFSYVFQSTGFDAVRGQRYVRLDLTPYSPLFGDTIAVLDYDENGPMGAAYGYADLYLTVEGSGPDDYVPNYSIVFEMEPNHVADMGAGDLDADFDLHSNFQDLFAARPADFAHGLDLIEALYGGDAANVPSGGPVPLPSFGDLYYQAAFPPILPDEYFEEGVPLADFIGDGGLEGSDNVDQSFWPGYQVEWYPPATDIVLAEGDPVAGDANAGILFFWGSTQRQYHLYNPKNDLYNVDNANVVDVDLGNYVTGTGNSAIDFGDYWPGRLPINWYPTNPKLLTVEGASANALQVVDLDLDGDLDVVVANGNADRVDIFYNQTQEETFTIKGDFAGDLPSRLATSGHFGNPLWNAGGVHYTAHDYHQLIENIGEHPISLWVGDLNPKYDDPTEFSPDIVVGCRDSHDVWIYEGRTSTGTWAANSTQNFRVGVEPTAVSYVDTQVAPFGSIRQYGNVIVVDRLNGYVEWLYTEGEWPNPEFYSAGVQNVGGWPTDVAVGDINADGWLDLAVANSSPDGSYVSTLYQNAREREMRTFGNFGLDWHTPIDLMQDLTVEWFYDSGAWLSNDDRHTYQRDEDNRFDSFSQAVQIEAGPWNYDFTDDLAVLDQATGELTVGFNRTTQPAIELEKDLYGWIWNPWFAAPAQRYESPDELAALDTLEIRWRLYDPSPDWGDPQVILHWDIDNDPTNGFGGTPPGQPVNYDGKIAMIDGAGNVTLPDGTIVPGATPADRAYTYFNWQPAHYLAGNEVWIVAEYQYEDPFTFEVTKHDFDYLNPERGIMVSETTPNALFNDSEFVTLNGFATDPARLTVGDSFQLPVDYFVPANSTAQLAIYYDYDLNPWNTGEQYLYDGTLENGPIYIDSETFTNLTDVPDAGLRVFNWASVPQELLGKSVYFFAVITTDDSFDPLTQTGPENFSAVEENWRGDYSGAPVQVYPDPSVQGDPGFSVGDVSNPADLFIDVLDYPSGTEFSAGAPAYIRWWDDSDTGTNAIGLFWDADNNFANGVNWIYRTPDGEDPEARPYTVDYPGIYQWTVPDDLAEQDIYVGAVIGTYNALTDTYTFNAADTDYIQDPDGLILGPPVHVKAPTQWNGPQDPEYLATHSQTWIVSADFNNDGELDIAATSAIAGDLVVYNGDGSGAFSLDSVYYLNASGFTLAAGDFWGLGGQPDDLPDLVVSVGTGAVGQTGAKLLVYPNDPSNPGTFLAPISTDLLPNPPSGVAEVYAARYLESTDTWRTGSFAPGTTDELRYDDFNHDGLTDLVATDYVTFEVSSGVYTPPVPVVIVRYGDGSGGFLPVDPDQDVTLWGGRQATILDANDDDYADIAAVVDEDIAREFQSGMMAVYNPPYAETPSPESLTILLNDRVGGLQEQFAMPGGLALSHPRWPANFALDELYDDFTVRPVDLQSNILAVADGDFNGDGITDIVVASHESSAEHVPPLQWDVAYVYLGQNDGRFGYADDIPADDVMRFEWSDWQFTQQGPSHIVTGDFNNDGYEDFIVICRDSDSAMFYQGKGDGTFLPGAAYSAGKFPTSAAVGDFDNDGWLDMVISNQATQGISALFNGHESSAPIIILDEPDVPYIPRNALFNISWIDADEDDDAVITLYWDTDDDYMNGGLNQIATGIFESINGVEQPDDYGWTVTLPVGTEFYIHAFITDGVDSDWDTYMDPIQVIDPSQAFISMVNFSYPFQVPYQGGVPVKWFASNDNDSTIEIFWNTTPTYAGSNNLFTDAAVAGPLNGLDSFDWLEAFVEAHLGETIYFGGKISDNVNPGEDMIDWTDDPITIIALPEIHNLAVTNDPDVGFPQIGATVDARDQDSTHNVVFFWDDDANPYNGFTVFDSTLNNPPSSWNTYAGTWDDPDLLFSMLGDTVYIGAYVSSPDGVEYATPVQLTILATEPVIELDPLVGVTELNFGSSVQVSWQDYYDLGDASIDLYWDTDGIVNSNETQFNTVPISEDPDGAGDSYLWDPIQPIPTPSQLYILAHIDAGADGEDWDVIGPFTVLAPPIIDNFQVTLDPAGPLYPNRVWPGDTLSISFDYGDPDSDLTLDVYWDPDHSTETVGLNGDEVLLDSLAPTGGTQYFAHYDLDWVVGEEWGGTPAATVYAVLAADNYESDTAVSQRIDVADNPYFAFVNLAPVLAVGENYLIQWEDEDVDSTDPITIYYDLDGVFNGNEVQILTSTDDSLIDQYSWLVDLNHPLAGEDQFYLIGVMTDPTVPPAYGQVVDISGPIDVSAPPEIRDLTFEVTGPLAPTLGYPGDTVNSSFVYGDPDSNVLSVTFYLDPDHSSQTGALGADAIELGTTAFGQAPYGTDGQFGWFITDEMANIQGASIYAVLETEDGLTDSTASAALLNIADIPHLTFSGLAPVLEVGGQYTVQWTDSDADSNDLIYLYWDLDGVWNGNETALNTTPIMEDLDGAGDQYVWDVPFDPAITDNGEVYFHAVVQDPTVPVVNGQRIFTSGPVSTVGTPQLQNLQVQDSGPLWPALAYPGDTLSISFEYGDPDSTTLTIHSYYDPDYTELGGLSPNAVQIDSVVYGPTDYFGTHSFDFPVVDGMADLQGVQIVVTLQTEDANSDIIASDPFGFADYPSIDLGVLAPQIELGSDYQIPWTDEDVDSNDPITLYYDFDGTFNGNEVQINASPIYEDPDGAGDTYLWAVPADPLLGTYDSLRIVAVIQDAQVAGVQGRAMSYSPNIEITDAPTVTIDDATLMPEAIGGEAYTIGFTATDLDDNAQVSLYYDADTIWNNGNETLIQGGLSEDQANSLMLYSWNPVPESLIGQSVYLVAFVTDGVTSAYDYGDTMPGQAGIDPVYVGDRPVIDLVDFPIGTEVATGSATVPLTIQWTATDRDDTATIDLFWDLDTNPNNDPAEEGTTWGTIATGLAEADGPGSYDWFVQIEYLNRDLYILGTIADDDPFGPHTDMDYTSNPVHTFKGNQPALIAQANVDGLWISIYDLTVDWPEDSTIDVAWRKDQYNKNVTDVLIVGSGKNDRQLKGIYYYNQPDNVGIVIEGDGYVKEIKDKRQDPSKTVGFIAAQPQVGKIDIKNGILGYDINGVTMGVAWDMPTDIDGDGGLFDLVSLYLTSNAETKSVKIREQVSGDIVTNDVKTFQMSHIVDDADVLIHGSVKKLQAGFVTGDSTLRADEIKTLQFGNWAAGKIEVQDIQKIDSGGILGADIQIDSGLLYDLTLKSAGTVSGNITTPRNIKTLDIKSGDLMSNVTARYLNTLKVRNGSIVNSSIMVEQVLKTVSVKEDIVVSDIEADVLGKIDVKGLVLSDGVNQHKIIAHQATFTAQDGAHGKTTIGTTPVYWGGGLVRLQVE